MKRKTLIVKMWLYFFLFSCIIMGCLFLLQTVFLNQFYEGMKASTMPDIAERITGAYGQPDYDKAINHIAAENGLQIFIIDADGNTAFISNEHGMFGKGRMDKPPLPDKQDEKWLLPDDYIDFLQKLRGSGEGSITYPKENQMGKQVRKMLIHGTYIGDSVLYISMPLTPVDSTVEVLQRQLLYVMGIAIAVGLVIAYFISRKLARPISDMTGSAAEMAKGNYDVTFAKGSYAELDQLAETLDYTAAQLSKVEKLRRDLIANISHDFRTPLTMIKAYAELIRDISGDDAGKRQQHLDIIIQETARMGLLVDDVLDLSLLQSGNEQPNLQNTDLSGLAQRVAESFAPMLERDGCALEQHIQPDQYAYADEKRMGQVIYNLMGNAVEHTNSRIALRVIDKGGSVRCEIEDDGPGIPDEDKPYIWERYYTSSQQPEKNSGLGLSIVKSILQQHGASFGVEGGSGGGSVFWFELGK